MNRLGWFGVSLSVIWGLIFGAVIWQDPEAAQNMGLNEWGDFLAGFSSPLALLWLVIGFFLQGKELHLNTEALKAQQEELRRQVEETAVLAKNAERQAAATETMADVTSESELEEKRRRRLEVMPRFAANGGTGSGSDETTILTNHGAEVYEVSIQSAEFPGFPNTMDISAWRTGQDFIMKLDPYNGEVFSFVISYRNSVGEKSDEVFEYLGKHQIRSLDTIREL